MELERYKRKGYYREQVDACIAGMRDDYEQRLQEQKERIFELKDRNTGLEIEVSRLKKREMEVSAALISAAQKSAEMEDASRKKYDFEIQRLRLFHLKWQMFFDRILDKYPLDEDLKSVADFTSRISNALRDGGGRTDEGAPAPSRVPPPRVKVSDAEIQFGREKARVEGAARSAAGTAAAASEDAGKFDIREALNPKEDLETILKELGI